VWCFGTISKNDKTFIFRHVNRGFGINERTITMKRIDILNRLRDAIPNELFMKYDSLDIEEMVEMEELQPYRDVLEQAKLDWWKSEDWEKSA
jgi:hypothetical protein